MTDTYELDPTTEMYMLRIDYLVRTAFLKQAQASAPTDENGSPALSDREVMLADEIGRLVADEMIVKGRTRALAEQVRETISDVVPEVMAKNAERLANLISPTVAEPRHLTGMNLDAN